MNDSDNINENNKRFKILNIDGTRRSASTCLLNNMKGYTKQRKGYEVCLDVAM